MMTARKRATSEPCPTPTPTPTPTGPIDRSQYMDAKDVQLLRLSAEKRARDDLEAGRIAGVVRWALVDVALVTGLRVCEISTLNVGDFNPQWKSLRIVRAKKSTKKPETLGISDELSKHLEQFIAWKDDVGQPITPESPLFASRARGERDKDGKLQRLPSGKDWHHMSTRNLQRMWKRALKTAGLPTKGPGTGIHTARHTLATHLLKRTRNLKHVQKQLGHSSPATTSNLYADVSHEDMVEALNGLYEDEGSK